MKFRILLLFILAPLLANAELTDTLSTDGGPIHRVELQAEPGAVLHTNQYLRGGNFEGRTMNHSFVTKLSYAFMKSEEDEQASIYKGAYQGFGLACHDFNEQLGNPVTAYILQGARIKTLGQRLSLDYEWNLGLTYGWHPFDKDTNPDNRVIGSKATAYINVDFYMCWRLSRHADLNAGISLTHFSNGNTKIPNAGLNVVGAKLGLAYYVNRATPYNQTSTPRALPHFTKHVSYDLVLYGAWKRMGFDAWDGSYAVPGSFLVAGFNLNPMYNLNHWVNVGASLDGIFDHSANIHFNEYANEVVYPKAAKQLALGLSGRAEFVMPYFTINLGMGHHFINARGHLDGWYEILALKVGLSRNVFLHIGYSLNDFKNPNNLMLGVGYRFHTLRKGW